MTFSVLSPPTKFVPLTHVIVAGLQRREVKSKPSFQPGTTLGFALPSLALPLLVVRRIIKLLIRYCRAYLISVISAVLITSVVRGPSGTWCLFCKYDLNLVNHGTSFRRIW